LPEARAGVERSPPGPTAAVDPPCVGYVGSKKPYEIHPCFTGTAPNSTNHIRNALDTLGDNPTNSNFCRPDLRQPARDFMFKSSSELLSLVALMQIPLKLFRMDDSTIGIRFILLLLVSVLFLLLLLFFKDFRKI
jgi:hypothetical protein